MSEHGHAGTAEAHGDHHYEYHGEPVEAAAPDEPVTPGWLTLLGITLVLAALLAYVATRPDGKTRAELMPTAPAGSGAAAAAAPAPANPGARQAVRPLASGFHPMPGMVPSAFLPRLGGSATPRPMRPPGAFAVQGGTPPGAPGGAPPPRRPPPVPQ